MNKIKYIFSILVLVVIMSPGVILAQSVSAPEGSIVSEINIQGAKIVDQVGNTFNLSFNFSNGRGVQSDVKYGVRLMSKSATGYKVADEQVYDEALYLAENSVINKNVVYVAPSVLSGAYSLFVTSFNTEGFPFGSVSLGKVNLSGYGKGVEIMADSCQASVNGGVFQSIPNQILIKPLETLKIKCTAFNQTSSSLSVLPTLKTRERTMYGLEVSDVVGGADNKIISFKPLEKKTFTLDMPVSKTPQSYLATVTLGQGQNRSNTVYVRYAVDGSSASILNISANADFYKRNDNASVMLLWSGNTNTNADVVIKSNKNTCGEASVSKISKGRADIAVSINKSCRNPNILVTLKNDKGEVLDTKSIDIQSASQRAKDALAIEKKYALGIVILIILILAIGWYMKKKNLNKGNIITTLLIAGSLALLPTAKASANVYVVGPNNDIYVDVNIDNGIYSPSSQIQVDGSIMSTSQNVVTLSAITIGNSQVDLFGGPVSIPPGGGQVFGNTQYLTAPSCSAPYTCPNTYYVAFSTGVEQAPPASCWQDGFRFVGQYRYGKIVFDGPYNTSGQQYQVSVQKYGSGNPNLNIDPNLPGGISTFLISRQQGAHSFSYGNNIDCGDPVGGSGCEIAGLDGFDHAVIVAPICSPVAGD